MGRVLGAISHMELCPDDGNEDIDDDGRPSEEPPHVHATLNDGGSVTVSPSAQTNMRMQPPQEERMWDRVGRSFPKYNQSQEGLFLESGTMEPLPNVFWVECVAGIFDVAV